jgi:hypothetical protein
MDRQQNEISHLELTTKELDDVSGGLKNNQTEAYHAFMAGMVKGYADAGGNVQITFG